MATVSDIVTRALRRAGVVDFGETPEAADSDAALTALNEMLFSWVARGVDTNPSTLVLTDTFPLDQKHELAVVALLATRLADETDIPITPKLAKDARDGWANLQADYVLVDAIRQDGQLARMSSRRIPY